MSASLNGFAAYRRTALYLSKLFFIALGSLPFSWASPLRVIHLAEEVDPKDPDNPSLWLDLAVSAVLVLLGGVFAGLTIALMGQDEINLQVISTSGKGAQVKHASRVLSLLKRGKHWVLVTLLLSNVIVNESLPIILDRSLGGGWPAVVGSTVAIVIFGEIIPQSVCVRFGLAIGAWCSPLVLLLMYIESPVAWPTAKLLDKLIGEEHGTTYSKAGLKTLVTIHKTFGEAGERLNEDEVTIIGAVLDLKNKQVQDIMTPMEDVFTMSLNTVLDEDTMENILSAGYSRIPIHMPNDPYNFVGMLLVKILITYDPEDCKSVRDFALATLPETAPETSCLDILNFFQEGKSHMVLVSENPGGSDGAVGVITLEDVIEELIGEEIVDESDVFIDVHKAIRRLQPAPRLQLARSAFTSKECMREIAASKDDSASDTLVVEPGPESSLLNPAQGTRDRSREVKPTNTTIRFASPRRTTLRIRRKSSGVEGVGHETITTSTNSAELREHLKFLGPSNLASRPRATRFTAVKIKPGAANGRASFSSVGEVFDRSRSPSHVALSTSATDLLLSESPRGGIGEGLLRDAGKDAQDGVQALHAGYGTMEQRPLSQGSRPRGLQRTSSHRSSSSEAQSVSTLHSLPEREGALDSAGAVRTPRGTTRSGSITENIIEYNGFTKLVLDVSSSSDDAPNNAVEEEEGGRATDTSHANGHQDNGAGKKKKKRRRRRRKADLGNDEGESLIDRDD